MEYSQIAVIGGGLAGMAAALTLANSGCRVMLLEKRDSLGGRAASIQDQHSGEEIDNAQHVLLGCCTSLLTFYKDLGIENAIRFYDSYPFMDAKGNISTLSNSFLPAPMHLIPSFWKLNFLSLQEKLAISRSLFKIMKSDDSPELAKVTIGEWLKKERQPAGAIKRFWHYLIVSVMNEGLDKVNCRHAFLFFKEAFLKSNKYSQLGIAKVPLSALYTPLKELLIKNNGKVLLNTSVKKIEFSDNKVNFLTTANNENKTVKADAFILALPPHQLNKLLPSKLLPSIDPEYTPILGIHLWFEKHFFPYEFLGLVDSPIHWIFNKRLNYNLGANAPEYIHLLVSASRELNTLPRKKIIEIAIAELAKYFPESRNIRLIKSSTTKEGLATFSPTPLFEVHRPEAATPYTNLFLAGDWTNTGWPSTMEGAVRSGNIAAQELLKYIGAIPKKLPPQSRTKGIIRE